MISEEILKDCYHASNGDHHAQNRLKRYLETIIHVPGNTAQIHHFRIKPYFVCSDNFNMSWGISNSNSCIFIGYASVFMPPCLDNPSAIYFKLRPKRYNGSLPVSIYTNATSIDYQTNTAPGYGTKNTIHPLIFSQIMYLEGDSLGADIMSLNGFLIELFPNAWEDVAYKFVS
jgi:hypothetical protein